MPSLITSGAVLTKIFMFTALAIHLVINLHKKIKWKEEYLGRYLHEGWVKVWELTISRIKSVPIHVCIVRLVRL